MGLLGEVVTNINTELVQMLNSVLEHRDVSTLQDTGTTAELPAVETKPYTGSEAH